MKKCPWLCLTPIVSFPKQTVSLQLKWLTTNLCDAVKLCLTQKILRSQTNQSVSFCLWESLQVGLTGSLIHLWESHWFYSQIFVSIQKSFRVSAPLVRIRWRPHPAEFGELDIALINLNLECKQTYFKTLYTDIFNLLLWRKATKASPNTMNSGVLEKTNWRKQPLHF